MRKTIRLLIGLLAVMCVQTAFAQNLDVKRHVLSNGLVVLAQEDHTVPTVAFHIVYKVGSRNERTGITGLSHLFEHMMFNGSKRFAPKEFDRLIEAGGGFSNAFTTTDTTEYYEEFSSATLDTVLQLEADRMRALRLDKQNVEQERGIVKEERRVNYDNSVDGSLYELLFNTAYVAHSYKWLPIGFIRDIDAITLEDAKAYFKTYYAPNNATVAVVGDFKSADLFKMVDRYFGDIARQPAPRKVTIDEPVQRGERRSILKMTAQLPTAIIGYHVGTYKDPDDPALDILSSILSSGESSRLYKSLVYDKQIATSVGASTGSLKDPGLYTIYVQAQQGHTTAECEQAIYAIIEDIAKDGVTPREMQKALNGLKVGYVNSFKTNDGRATLLSDYESNWGDWKMVLQYMPRHDRVTPADVQRVAAKYLREDNRTVVTLVPTDNSTQTGGAGK